MSVPLIEDGGTDSSSSGGATAADGPSVRLVSSDGTEVVIGPDALVAYAALLQTVLLVFLVYREVNA